MTIDTYYSISVSQQDDSFTCGLHVAKNMLAFMNINSTRCKKSIELQQWKISDFGDTRNFNAFIKNKNIEFFSNMTFAIFITTLNHLHFRTSIIIIYLTRRGSMILNISF